MNKILDYNPAIEGDILVHKGKEPEKFKYMEIDGVVNKRFCISTYGRVFNTHRKIEYTKFREEGYLFVRIKVNGRKRMFYVHKLMAKHFIPRTKRDIVNRKNSVMILDGNIYNLHISNLKWEKLSKVRGVITHRNIDDIIVHKICKCLEDGESLKSIQSQFEDLGVTYNIVYNIATKRSWADISNKYKIDYKRNNVSRSKISPTKVRLICRLLEEGFSMQYIEDKLSEIGVTYNMIYPIAVGRTWRDISCKYKLPLIREREEKKIC